MRKEVACIVFLSLVLRVSSRWEGKLKYREDGTFVILQLTDIHLSKADAEDFRTIGLIYRLVAEVRPDLVVFTGDQLSGYSRLCREPTLDQQCYQQVQSFRICEAMEKYTLPMSMLNQKYAIIIGNHDAQANLNDREIMELDSRHPLSLSQVGPDHVNGGSNYYLPIYDEWEENIESLLWMFDSHDTVCMGKHSPNGCVDHDQIEWFERQYRELLESENKQMIQSLSFVHIPPPEYSELVNQHEIYGNVNEDVCCPCYKNQFVLKLMENDVKANFVGHDHNNDFSGHYKLNDNYIDLHYGRKTGYGGYGPPSTMLRGGKVITMTNLGQGQFNYTTHIVEENGNKIHRNTKYKAERQVSDCKCYLTNNAMLNETFVIILLVVLLF